jgi:uncharacterized protein
MNDSEFQWDDGKAARNYAKHNITFEMAREAFNDFFFIDWLDDSQDEYEQRFAHIGMSVGRLLFVAYTMRGESIRIISARLATSVERRLYPDEHKK